VDGEFEYRFSRWARSPFSFEAQKKQNACQQIGFFAAQGRAAQAGRTTGCNILPCCRSLMALLLQNLLCPSRRSRPPLFCPLLAETYLLTGVRMSFGV
jgi:hypothetical protein